MSNETPSTIKIDEHPVFSFEAFGNSEPDKYVYHYTSWERLLDIAETGLRLGPLATMNDPRESKNWYLGTIREVDRSLDGSTFNKAVADFKAKVRVAAFSIDQPYGNANDQSRRGYGRPRMWAQYGQNHRGVCIVMDRKAVDSAIRSRYDSSDGSWILADKVNYIATAAEDPTSRGIPFVGDRRQIEDIVREHLTAHAKEFFFLKHTDWRGEHEYRWVFYDAEESGTGPDGWKFPFVNIESCVSALILGADYENAHLPVARMFAERHGLHGDIVKCQWQGLNLRLQTFADDGERLSPIPYLGPVSLHILVGKPEPKTGPDS